MRTLPHPAAEAAHAIARHSGRITPPVDKRFATAQAHAMWFYGIRLDAIDDDDGAPQYVATLQALTRRFRTLPEVEGWLHALDALDAPRQEVERFLRAREQSA